MGDSAGANLALAFALMLRDFSRPLPRRLALLSPALDATLSGKSIKERASREALLTLQKLNFMINAYLSHHRRDDPYVSPVYADLKGLPPLLVHVGTEELLYSDSERISENAKRDGCEVELLVGQGMWHGWHIFAGLIPEAQAAMEEVGAFVLK